MKQNFQGTVFSIYTALLCCLSVCSVLHSISFLEARVLRSCALSIQPCHFQPSKFMPHNKIQTWYNTMHRHTLIPCYVSWSLCHAWARGVISDFFITSCVDLADPNPIKLSWPYLAQSWHFSTMELALPEMRYPLLCCYSCSLAPAGLKQVSATFTAQ